MTTTEVSQDKVPVSFFTKTSAYVVPERPILVPVTSTPTELSDLICHLIAADGEELPASVSFNFLFESVADVQTLLRGQLKKMLLEAGWTLERTVRLEYFEASPEPQLQCTIDHPDWIKTISSSGNLFGTGCYDGSLRLFTRGSDEAVAGSTVTHHSMAITGVAFVPNASKCARVVTVSMDQTALALHQSSSDSGLEKSFKLANFGSGDASEPFTSVAVSRRGDWIAAGSSSGKISVYSGRREEQDDESVSTLSTVTEPAKKKSRKAPVPVVPETKTRRSRFVLEGAHSAAVTAVLFDRVDHKNTGNPLLFSASLDGSIRAWDLSEQSFAFILSCDTPITSLAHHPTNGKLFLSGHPDGSVRLWDISVPLFSSSALQPTTFFAGNPEVMKKRLLALHKGWITALAWSPRDENLFASAGHDGSLHIWDIRSNPANPLPQYTLKTGNALKDQHEVGNGKILAIDWAADGFLRFGGEDCKLAIYSTR